MAPCYTWDRCWEDFQFMKVHGLWAAMLGAGVFAGKNFKEKAGIFAAQPPDDAVAERRRNNALFLRVVDDMRHSNWPAMLRALPEDGQVGMVAVDDPLASSDDEYHQPQSAVATTKDARGAPANAAVARNTLAQGESSAQFFADMERNVAQKLAVACSADGEVGPALNSD